MSVVPTKTAERARAIEEILTAFGKPVSPKEIWDEVERRENVKLDDVARAVYHKVLQWGTDRFEQVGRALWTVKKDPTTPRLLENILLAHGGQAELQTIYAEYGKLTGKDMSLKSNMAAVRSSLQNAPRGDSHRFFSSERGIWQVRGAAGDNTKEVIRGIIGQLKERGILEDMVKALDEDRAEEERNSYRTASAGELRASISVLRDRIVAFRNIDGDPAWLQDVDQFLEGAAQALLKSMTAGRKPAQVGVGRRQAVRVVELMRRGTSFAAACELVATEFDVGSSAVRDACTRRLGKTQEEFEALASDEAFLKALVQAANGGA